MFFRVRTSLFKDKFFFSLRTSVLGIIQVF